MAFYEATQLQAFRPDGGIDPRWTPHHQQQQQQQHQGQGQQQQTQYEAKQEQILGEDSFPAVIDKNELVWQEHAASQEDAHAYDYENQYEYTPALGSGVPEYDDATTQWQDAHQSRQYAHDPAHYHQQQQQGYYHPDEQPHHDQAYSQQDQSQSLTLTQLHAAGGRPNYEQHAPAQPPQIQHQPPIQQQPRGDGNAIWAVKEEVADARYRAHIALSADAILRGQGAGSGCGSSSLIPSSSSSAGSSPMKMKSEMEVNLGGGSGMASFLTPAQELQLQVQQSYAPQQEQGQYEDYPQQQHQQQGYESHCEQGYAEQDVYHAQLLNHSHQQYHQHQHRQQQEQQRLSEMELDRQHLEREHHMAWARREQQYERGRREAMEAEREQIEADRAVQHQQQQQHSQAHNANHQHHHQQEEWDRDADAEGDEDEEELELPARIVPSQAHLPPTHASQAHLLPTYPQQQHGYGHHHQQYQGQRVIDPDAPFINPLTSGIPPLHASQPLSHPRANSKSPRDRDTGSSGKGKGKAAGSTLGSPIKLGPAASLGSALGTIIPARRGRGPGRAGSLGSLGPGLDVGPGSNASAGAKGPAGVGMGELGAGDDAGERERPPEKKQALACLFCRERKIACGRPEAGSDDPTCNQCARRHICCEYPKESRRGQHKRTRKRKFGHGSEMAAEGGEGHDVNEGRLMTDTVDFREGAGGAKAEA